jgi:hypothetical protein
VSNPDASTTESGFLERVRRVIAHAEEAARCYLALIAAEGRRMVRRLMYEAVWMLALVGYGLIGLAVLALGLGAFVESRIGVPGSGQMIVGGGMVIVCFIGLYVIKVRKQP